MKRTILASSLIVALFYMFGSLQPYLNLFVTSNLSDDVAPILTALWFFLSGFFLIMIVYIVQFQFKAHASSFELDFIQGKPLSIVFLNWSVTQALHLFLGLCVGTVVGVFGSYLWMMSLSLLMQEPISLVWIFQPNVLLVTSLFFCVVSVPTLLYHIIPLRRKVFMGSHTETRAPSGWTSLLKLVLCFVIYWICYQIIQMPLGALVSFPIVVPIGYVTTIVMIRSLGTLMMSKRSYRPSFALTMRCLGTMLRSTSKMSASAIVLIMFCFSALHFSSDIASQMKLQTIKNAVFNTDASIQTMDPAHPPFDVVIKQNQEVVYLSYSTYETVALAQSIKPEPGPYLFQRGTQLLDLSASFNPTWLDAFEGPFQELNPLFTLSEKHTTSSLIVVPNDAFESIALDQVRIVNQINTQEKHLGFFDMYREVFFIGATTSLVFGLLACITQALALSNYWDNTKYQWQTPLTSTMTQCQRAACLSYVIVLCLGLYNGWMAMKGLKVTFGTSLTINLTLLGAGIIIYFIVTLISIGGIMHVEDSKLRKIL